MRNSPYSQIARSAAQCEEFGNLSEAAVLWHQASEVAVLDANRDWSEHHANVCEIRLISLSEGKSSRWKIGGAAFSMQNLSSEKPERRGLAKLVFAGPRR